MSTDKLFYLAAKAIIRDKKGRILLFHAGLAPWRVIKEPYWDLPGGRIQSGQSALDALRYEIEEETGVTEIGEPKFITCVISNHDVSTTKDQEIGLALFIYEVAIPKDSKIVMSKEHVAYEWVSNQEAAKRLAHKYPEDFRQLLVGL